MRLFKRIVGGLLALAVLAWAMIFLLSRDFLPHPDLVAIDWLEKTPNGLVNPPWVATHWYGEWKAIFLRRTAPQVEAAVFGLSTVMTLSAQALPKQKLYNYSFIHSNYDIDLNEVSYVLDHASNLKTIILAFDLFPGFYRIEKESEAPRVKAALDTGAFPDGFDFNLNTLYSYYEAFREEDSIFAALWPLKNSTLTMMERIQRRWRRMKTSDRGDWREWFEPMVFECPFIPHLMVLDIGNLLCSGFYPDGSFNFGMSAFPNARGVFFGWIPEADQYAYAMERKDIYEQHLHNRLPVILARISELFERAKRKGVSAYLLFPPLEPGLEAKVFGTPIIGNNQRFYKTTVEEFAKLHGIQIADASASERFGCVRSQFINENHATPECYNRILKDLIQASEQTR